MGRACCTAAGDDADGIDPPRFSRARPAREVSRVSSTGIIAASPIKARAHAADWHSEKKNPLGRGPSGLIWLRGRATSVTCSFRRLGCSGSRNVHSGGGNTHGHRPFSRRQESRRSSFVLRNDKSDCALGHRLSRRQPGLRLPLRGTVLLDTIVLRTGLICRRVDVI